MVTGRWPNTVLGQVRGCHVRACCQSCPGTTEVSTAGGTARALPGPAASVSQCVLTTDHVEEGSSVQSTWTGGGGHQALAQWEEGGVRNAEHKQGSEEHGTRLADTDLWHLT